MNNDIPDNLYRAEQVRELDRRAIEEFGMPGFELMQRAARASYEAMKASWPAAKKIHVVCGGGNNGGDGLVLAALALADGYAVSLELLVGPADLKGDAGLAWQCFAEAGGVLCQQAAVIDADVVVDAVLGTGASRPLEGKFRTAVERINQATREGAKVLSLDLPSGLHADTGAILGVAVQADLTVSFIGLKVGLLTGSGPAQTGKLLFDSLQVPDAVYESQTAVAQIIQDSLRQRYLPPRAVDAHKNRHGHVLCVGGDYGTGGAIRLAAEAALRSGAGLVSVATRFETANAMSQSCPELMCVGVESAEMLYPLLEKADAVLIGPGLGQSDWGRALWASVVECRQPLVMDADALNILASNPGDRGNWVLTPHPGEAARLLSMDKSSVQSDRMAVVEALAERYAAVALLKGAGSLIKGPAGALQLCAHGNPGMAVGGMGDLLSGVIVALIAQGIPLFEATCVAVDIHARAGDKASAQGQRGLLPTDLLPLIRQLVNP